MKKEPPQPVPTDLFKAIIVNGRVPMYVLVAEDIMLQNFTATPEFIDDMWPAPK